MSLSLLDMPSASLTSLLIVTAVEVPLKLANSRVPVDLRSPPVFKYTPELFPNPSDNCLRAPDKTSLSAVFIKLLYVKLILFPVSVLIFYFF